MQGLKPCPLRVLVQVQAQVIFQKILLFSLVLYLSPTNLLLSTIHLAGKLTKLFILDSAGITYF
jgi:hypothetical protein